MIDKLHQLPRATTQRVIATMGLGARQTQGDGLSPTDLQLHVLRFSTTATHGTGVVIPDTKCQLLVWKFRTIAVDDEPTMMSLMDMSTDGSMPTKQRLLVALQRAGGCKLVFLMDRHNCSCTTTVTERDRWRLYNVLDEQLQLCRCQPWQRATLLDQHSHVLKFSTAAAHGTGVVISDVECQLRVLKFRTAAASRDRRKLTRLLTSPY